MDKLNTCLTKRANDLAQAKLALLDDEENAELQAAVASAQEAFNKIKRLIADLKEEFADLPEFYQQPVAETDAFADQETTETASPSTTRVSPDMDSLEESFDIPSGRNFAPNHGGRIKLPRFSDDLKKEPVIFMRMLQDALQTNGVPVERWPNYLASCLDSKEAIWYYKFVHGRQYSWQKIVRLFESKFEEPDHVAASLRQLAEIRQQPKESADAFTARFRDLMYDAELDPSDATAVMWFQNAVKPEHRSTVVAMLAAMDNPSIVNASELLRRLENAYASNSGLPQLRLCVRSVIIVGIWLQIAARRSGRIDTDPMITRDRVNHLLTDL